jgi:hypothetical protein
MNKKYVLGSLLILALTMTGCQNGNNNNPSSGGANSDSSIIQPSKDPGEITGGTFNFNEDELNTAQEIHTANQLKYLNLSKDYYDMTKSDLDACDAMGNKNVSTPEKTTLNWEFTAPDGYEVKNYTLVFSQSMDLSDPYTVVGTKEPTISFYNSFLGTNYFKIVANFTTGDKQSSDVKTFKVTEQAPRNLYVGNMPNFRDMGGRTTYAGGKIKQGLIYRGAGNKFDNRSSINSECTNVLSKQLKIKTEINVANSTGNNVNLSGSKVVDAFMAYGATPYSNLARNSVRIRQVMDTLADINNYPVFYHCRIGTDRTGITGMMIGGLLGIPFNEVFQDYCFSNFAPIDGQRYPNKPSDPNGDDPAKYIDEILKMPGKNYQEQTYNALLSIGCPAEKLDRIINFMTEGPKANLNNDQKIGIGNGLSSTASQKVDGAYKNPAISYQMISGMETSFATETTGGRKDVVVYLGSQDSNKSTKLANCIQLKIDGIQQTIVDKTLFLAGFGKTQQNGRTGYMFNLLGTYNFSNGNHTISICVISGTFYLGTICVFDHVEPME